MTGMDVRREITRLRRKFTGDLGLAARNVRTGEAISVNGEMVAPTASMIKICVLVELFRQRQDGRVRLSDVTTVTSRDKVGGSGLLDCMQGNIKLKVYDIAVLMMAISDNTATNKLIDLCGIGNINRMCRESGMSNTKVRRKINFKGKRGIDKPPFAEGSPIDFVNLMTNLYQGEILGKKSVEELLEIMRIQKYMGHLNRYLPFNPYARELQSDQQIWVASKTGGVKGVRTEAGLIGTHDATYAVCIMTKDCKDERWNAENEGNVAVANASRLVFDYFTQQGKPARKRQAKPKRKR